MSAEQRTTGRRELVGKVVSDKMAKTVTVEVVRHVTHPVYHKYMARIRRYKAHDEHDECKVDDVVVIRESRPLSATKRWVVIERRPATA
jgi:small subunit ribosomal protein S17